MKWSDFAEAAPEVARLAEERIERTGLVLLGTLRADGWPRISPIEPIIFDGHLIVGGTRGTRKTADLVRDSRCVVNTIVADKEGTEGEIKLAGLAHELTDARILAHLAEDILKRHGFRPRETTYHHFWMDIKSASYIVFRDDLTNRIVSWREGQRVAEIIRRWTLSGYASVE